MSLYDTVRYQVGPPLMVVGVTMGVQVMTSYGGGGLTTPWSLLGSYGAWVIVNLFWLWAFLSLWIPGATFIGPMPQHGDPPRYKANGFQFFLVSLGFYTLLLFAKPELASYIFKIFPEILAVCNIEALILCVYLLIQGKTNPQTNEKLEPKPIMYEFYRGMEVHPYFLGTQIKQLTNCRFGLLAWQLLVVTFFVAGWRENGFSLAHLVCVILQTVYLAKFYWWETGYFNTLDITLDRAGYYICWGCIVLVPSLYTFSSFFLVAHPPQISNSGATLCLMSGLISIALNYRADWEKEHFRFTNGKCSFWGKPVTFIKASYVTQEGKEKTSLLLTSGLWGVSRHLNYVFELLLALSWSLPGLGLGIGPFFYFIFLTILLVHRVYRDEEKCSAKYGKFYDEYCRAVPYRLIPYIF